MKIVVAYKWAANPQDASVAADGSVDWSRTKDAVSDYDPQAFEVGRVLADTTSAELIGLTVGGPSAASPMAKKAALSRGLDRLVVVSDESLTRADTTQTALVLAAAVQQLGDVDLILTGDSSVDMGAQMVPSVLAGALGWPVLTDVTSVTSTAGSLVVEQAYLGGRRVLAVSGPAVLSVASDATKPRIPGMKDILSAGTKPAEYVTLGSLTTSAVMDVRVLQTGRPQLKTRRRDIIDGSDAASAARDLVSKLKADGLA